MQNNVVTIHPIGLPEDDFIGPEFARLSGRSSRRQNNKKVACTVCSRKEYPSLGQHREHPILKVLVCKECNEFYASGEFLKDENGIDEHCRWCGDGADVLAICDLCTNVFCKQCIQQNFNSRTALNFLHSTSFKCFVCDSTPILERQRECQKIFAELRQKNKRQKPETRSRSHTHSKEKGVDQTGKLPDKINGNCSPNAHSQKDKEAKRVPKLRIQIKANRDHQVVPEPQTTNRDAEVVEFGEDHNVEPPAAHSLQNGHHHSSSECSNEKKAKRFLPAKKTSFSDDKRTVNSFQSWKGHYRTRVARIRNEITNLGRQVARSFNEASETPWSMFAALKAIQEVKNDSSALLSTIENMHSRICKIEEALSSHHHHISGDTTTTAKESENDSIDSSLSTPTKRKFLRKRKERELLRRRNVSGDTEILKPRLITNDEETNHPTTSSPNVNAHDDLKLLSDASKGDIFQGEHISVDSEEENMDLAPTSDSNSVKGAAAAANSPNTSRRSSPEDRPHSTLPQTSGSHETKKGPKIVFTSSDSDVLEVTEETTLLHSPENPKTKTTSASKLRINVKEEPGEKKEQATTSRGTYVDIPSTSRNQLDESSDQDADLFKPIASTPNRRAQTPREKGSKTKPNSSNRKTSTTEQKGSSSNDDSILKRPDVKRKRKLFVDSEGSEDDEEEHMSDDDDFVQKLPEHTKVDAFGQAETKQNDIEGDADVNEIAFQHLFRNMMESSVDDGSDTDVDEILKPKPSAQRKESRSDNDDPDTNVKKTSEISEKSKETRSDDDTTRRNSFYKHPLLNVPISVSDGEVTRSSSDRKRRATCKKSGHGQIKKRRKLHMEEALKDENLAFEDLAILKNKVLGTTDTQPEVVLCDIKYDEDLRHFLQPEQTSSSNEAAPTEDPASQWSRRPRISSSSSAEMKTQESNDSESLLPPKATNAPQTTPGVSDTDLDSDDTILNGKSGDSDSDSDVELLTSDLLASSEPDQKPCSSKSPQKSSSETTDNDLPVFTHNRVFSKKKGQSLISDFVKREASEDDFALPLTSKTKKRRRIVMNDSDSDDAYGDGPAKKSGRRNIRKIIDDDSLSQATQDAERMESERMRRLRKHDDDLEEEVIIVEDESSPMKKKITTTRLILSKEPLVEVDSGLVQKLKPHQVEGVKFIWKNVIESVSVARKYKGDGCILAHCMGLGKTFQVVTILHTVLLTPFLPKINTALVLCPLGIVINWAREFVMWTRCCRRSIRIFDVSQKSNYERCMEVKKWQRLGGVMIISYGTFKSLCQGKGRGSGRYKDTFMEHLLTPGPDVIVCDEGHVIKNAKTDLSTLVSKVQTRRRIVLTGTPLQNNLMEYHCMVSFIKPGLLGNSVEFANRFANPIANGQHVDSTKGDVHLMKKRSHILHKLLAGFVQRKDVGCLRELLEPKFEYVLLVRLSPLQVRLYEAYLNRCSGDLQNKKVCLFLNFNNLLMVNCHPRILYMAKARREKRKITGENQANLKRMINDHSDDEDDDVDDDDDGSSDETNTRKDLVLEKLPFMSIQELKRIILDKGGDLRGAKEKSDLVDLAKSLLNPQSTQPPLSWFESVMPAQDELYRAVEHSGKVVILLEILNHAAVIGDKVVVFSQSLLTLDFIEEVLMEVTKKRENGKMKRLPNALWRWYRNVDYYRMDGSTNAGQRKKYIEQFNDDNDHRGRLFLISTKAGGIGVNLVGANRAVVFDACWNPTHDLQSIFRIYRFGQKKICYVYRLIAQGTMEEKIYNRQVLKQSLAYRVVDEQQIVRHFSAEDISDLYDFSPNKLDEKSMETLRQKLPPKDPLLSELLQQANTRDAIVSYHEHESLLDHQVEEELSEAERRLAWDEYDRERRKIDVSQSPLLKLKTADLQNLLHLAEAELNRTTETLSKIKDEELHVIMLRLKACDPEMGTERLQASAVSIQAKEILLKEQMQRTQRFILTKIDQLKHVLTLNRPTVHPNLNPEHTNPNHPTTAPNTSTQAPGSNYNYRPRYMNAQNGFGYKSYMPQYGAQYTNPTTGQRTPHSSYYTFRPRAPPTDQPRPTWSNHKEQRPPYF